MPTTTQASPLALFDELLTAMESIGLLDADATFDDVDAALARGEDDAAELSTILRTP